MDDRERVFKLLRQQSAIAGFGSFALRQTDLQAVLDEAARACAKGLDVTFCKICRFQPESDDLLVVAGVGWREGVIGQAVSKADATTPQGRAFTSGDPAIARDLRIATGYVLPAFYAAHGIISTVDVVIKGAERPYGVLEVDSDVQLDFDPHDIDFLTGFANVLAEAVSTSERTAVLQSALAAMRALVTDKDLLLEKTRVLAQELQHRVRNNLQLIYGMLTNQMVSVNSEVAERGLSAIARRVSTLAQVYDHLIGADMAETAEAGAFLRSLCVAIAAVQAQDRIRLDCATAPVFLDLDTVTALGIITTEIVTNCYEHAFPEHVGVISVDLRRVADHPDLCQLTLSDTGPGFVAAPLSKRHGIGLVRRLAEQIGGTATLSGPPGAVWTIVFPAAP